MNLKLITGFTGLLQFNQTLCCDADQAAATCLAAFSQCAHQTDTASAEDHGASSIGDSATHIMCNPIKRSLAAGG